MRKPTNIELKALDHFVGNIIQTPESFPKGVGKGTLEELVNLGWIEWVDSPETYEHGYRITEAGNAVLAG